MSAPKSTPPADLASLEHAFAADPSSDAWRPLTEAYLSMGRFMEAMVVAKKGVRSHPADVGARLLLSRVYADQGKDRRALEEVQAALAASPSSVPALLRSGELHFRLGEKEPGVAALRQAGTLQPGDAEVREALQRWGVELPAALPPPPPPPAPVVLPPIPSPVAASPSGPPVLPRIAAPAPVASPPVVRPPVAPPAPPSAPPPVAAPARPAAPAPAHPAEGAAATARPAASRAAPRKGRIDRDLEWARELSEKYESQEWRIPTGKTGSMPLPPERKKSHALRNSIVLVVGLAVILGGWWAFTAWRRSRDEEVSRLLKEAGELIAKDGHSQYVRATALLDKVLQRDPSSLGGHAYLAYVDAIRFGEHGEGDTFREAAQKHLAAARSEKANHSHAIAADAYLKSFGGDTPGAIASLTRVLKGPEGGTSGLLYGALGVLQMQTGDLDGARESLVTARKFADRDVRVNQMLAEVYRRGGQARKAKTFYDAAYALSRDHVPTLLGAASVYIDEGQWDTALKFVQAVLDGGEASPRQAAMARALKGTILYAKGRGAEGAQEEQAALTLDPANPDLQDQIGRRKLASGDAAGAAAAFQKAADMDPQRVAFQSDLARALLAQPGGAKAAVAALTAAQGRLPGNARLAKLLGDAWLADGDLDRARVEYEKAAAARSPEARLALARLQRSQKRIPEALAEYEKAAREFGESGSEGAGTAYAEMAETEAQRGAEPARVAELYRKALAVDPTNCPALWALGRERAGRSDKDQRDLARQMLGDYARSCPRGPHAAEAAQLAASLR